MFLIQKQRLSKMAIILCVACLAELAYRDLKLLFFWSSFLLLSSSLHYYYSTTSLTTHDRVNQTSLHLNSIGVVMVSMVTLSVVDCGFMPKWGKTKD